MLKDAGVSAGHGSQVRDNSGDEVDGLNETLCPCDFKNVRIPMLACVLALACLLQSAFGPPIQPLFARAAM